jgi:DnaJ-class molecular chaperone
MESAPIKKSEESKNSSKQSIQSELLIQAAAPQILASSPIVETSFPCMKCEGKGVSKKTQCSRCLGSGKANKDFQSLLMHSLRAMIREIIG